MWSLSVAVVRHGVHQNKPTSDKTGQLKIIIIIIKMTHETDGNLNNNESQASKKYSHHTFYSIS